MSAPNASLLMEINKARRERLEQALALQIRAAQLPEPGREVVFASPRKWRFDFLFRQAKLAVEVQGGTWQKGGSGHTTGSGYARDCEKLCEAVALGYRVLFVTGEMVESGQALRYIERCLGRI